MYSINSTLDTPNASRTEYHSYDEFRNTQTPLVIDNGSWQFRAGWAGEIEPRLQYANILCKYKDRITGAPTVYVGDEALNIGQSVVTKTPFDCGAFLNSKVFETILCYALTKLNIDESSVDHPIIMTESLCSLRHSRKITSELLFEGFGVPSVTYGIDSAFSYYYNRPKTEDSLIASFGNASTTILPFLGGAVATEHSYRISFGASQAYDYMLKLLKYKYPNFPLKIDINHAQTLVKNYCYVSLDYNSDIRDLAVPSKIREQELVVQFPYTPVPRNNSAPKDMERIAEQRREQAARMREERFKNKKKMLQTFKDLKQKKKTMSKSEFSVHLRECDFEDEADLDNEIETLELSIQRSESKANSEEEQEVKKKQNFDLINIPDDTLTDGQKKEKKKQKLLYAGYEARERLKREKQAEKEHQMEMERLDNERRLKDPESWLQEIRERRQKLIDRMSYKQRRRMLLNDRRSRESQLRMKSIASLAGEENTSKRRRGTERESEDNFGANDDDWIVYRQIDKDYNSSGEEDLTSLNKFEELLMAHDPTFVPEDVYEEGQASKSTIMYYLAHDPQSDASDIAVQNQIRLNVERIRVPEILHNPSIAGMNQAGVTELISNLSYRFDKRDQDVLKENVFITGGFSQLKNLAERIKIDLTRDRPYLSIVNTYVAQDPILDAWRGASRWVVDDRDEFLKACITKHSYEECGHDYLVEHRFSNKWCPLDSPGLK